jgi:heat shock protein HslJ
MRITMKNMKIVLFTTTLMLMLVACSGIGPQTAQDPLEGTSWDLFAYRKTSPIEGTSITAEFVDGKVQGSAGCNSYSGAYKVDGERIEIGPIMMTEMACMEPEGVMDQELYYLEFLGAVSRIQFVDDQLQLFDGHEALTFIPAP